MRLSIPLCTTSDFQDSQAREFELNGQSIILISWYGAWYAYINNCPHANWPLNLDPDVFFDSDRQFLQCSNHMALFEVKSGICQAGPCVGDRLVALPVEIRGDKVYVEVDSIKSDPASS
jgi:nitrite reductase/ring-hydroxylating ferredoxin subunit